MVALRRINIKVISASQRFYLSLYCPSVAFYGRQAGNTVSLYFVPGPTPNDVFCDIVHIYYTDTVSFSSVWVGMKLNA